MAIENPRLTSTGFIGGQCAPAHLVASDSRSTGHMGSDPVPRGSFLPELFCPFYFSFVILAFYCCYACVPKIRGPLQSHVCSPILVWSHSCYAVMQFLFYIRSTFVLLLFYLSSLYN